MSNFEAMIKAEWRSDYCVRIRPWSFGLPSSFIIRHFENQLSFTTNSLTSPPRPKTRRFIFPPVPRCGT